jgi:NAD-dependent dihydropyrimidine dehydrogenase PreA subunit
MKINDGCVRCGLCAPHCPVAAIGRCEDGAVFVEQDECVECGVCLNSGVCPVNAIYQPELNWPRVLRAMWSSVVFVHPETRTQGRGTEEMKTNDVTGRFKLGEVGFGVELGRPSTGARFEDAEKVTTALARHGVEFEPMNPLTRYIDARTGRFLDSWQGHPLDGEFRRTKVMTFIVEFKTKQDRMLEVIETLRRVSEEIDTVMSVGMISKCTEDGRIPVKPLLDEHGIEYYINGKTCVGLGKPAYQFVYE